MADQFNPIPRMGISTGRYVPNIGENKVPNTNGVSTGKDTFSDVLSRISSYNNELKYSAHALKRLEDRNISFSKDDVQDIQNAIELAKGKNVRESLVLIKDVALIINIPSKTVITAVDKESMKNNVFTNIDGAIII